MQLRSTTRVTAMVIVVAMALLIGALLGRSREAPIRITFQGYDDYWETRFSPLDASRPPMLHCPREARFMVKNQAPGVIGIWAGARLEFKQPAKLVDVVPGCQGALAPEAVMHMIVVLTGTERGQWRILVPFSEMRLLMHVEHWIGMGTVSNWIREHQKASPHWIASDWVNELPQRSLMPPAEIEPDQSDQVVRLRNPR